MGSKDLIQRIGCLLESSLRRKKSKELKDALELVETDQTLVILLPGLFGSSSGLFRLEACLRMQYPLTFFCPLDKHMGNLEDSTKIVLDYIDVAINHRNGPKIKKIVVIGHSMGGRTALEVVNKLKPTFNSENIVAVTLGSPQKKTGENAKTATEVLVHKVKTVLSPIYAGPQQPDISMLVEEEDRIHVLASQDSVVKLEQGYHPHFRLVGLNHSDLVKNTGRMSPFLLATITMWENKGAEVVTPKLPGDEQRITIDRNGSKIEIEPGTDIQRALDLTADLGLKELVLLKGVYSLQSAIIFTSRHANIRLSGELDSEQKPITILDGKMKSRGMIVDGVGTASFAFQIENLCIRNTTTIGSLTLHSRDDIDIVDNTRHSVYAVNDGSALLITGNTHGSVRGVYFENNRSGLCAGGINIQQRCTHGELKPIVIRECTFLNNVAAHAGAAIDVFKGFVVIKDNKFKGNKSNYERGRHNGVVTLWEHTIISLTNNSFELGETQQVAVDYRISNPGGLHIKGNVSIRAHTDTDLYFDYTVLWRKELRREIVKAILSALNVARGRIRNFQTTYISPPKISPEELEKIEAILCDDEWKVRILIET